VGTKERQTIEKEAAREMLRARVVAKLGPMVDAQIDQALGLKYLVRRDKKTGQFVRVTAEQAGKAPKGSVEEVWEKDPSTSAFADLMNRALDKPKEQERELKVTGSLELVDRLHAARKRLAERKEQS
jgi:leucyl aminopeptidase (aminopeptidase T)